MGPPSASRSSDQEASASVVRGGSPAEPKASAASSTCTPRGSRKLRTPHRRLGGGSGLVSSAPAARNRCWAGTTSRASAALMLASASSEMSVQQGRAEVPSRAGGASPPWLLATLAWTAAGGMPRSLAASARCRPRSPARARSYMPALRARARHLRLPVPVTPGQAVSRRPRRVAAALGHNKQRYWPAESGASGTCSRYSASDPHRATITGPSSAARGGVSRAGRRRSTIALAHAATKRVRA